ncbi:MAG: hypothetical protein JRH20_01590 [Deltaproteobacteria bacterium]|nr:hypothetical protein [Deltaproteobacteria bacterium]
MSVACSPSHPETPVDATVDSPYVGDVWTPPPLPDLGDAQPQDLPDPCHIFTLEGQDCSGGQTCPDRFQPMIESGTICRCRVACDPSASLYCANDQCGYNCVQLNDPGGNPMPGIGACIRNEGSLQGEPCAPKQCITSLVCVGNTEATSYCRKTCLEPEDCTGYKMLCIKLATSATKVCMQGGSSLGPEVDVGCLGDEYYCNQGLFCDPTLGAQICRQMCNTDEPSGDACPEGKTCQPLFDEVAQVLIGYGCK